MPVYVIANPKGGVGKSTLSTNLAGYFASLGQSVMLGDMDAQQSSAGWLALRPGGVGRITGWELAEAGKVRPPKGTTHVVLDTPAGLAGKRLDSAMGIADRVLVPLQPSLFDIQATHRFVSELRAHPRGADMKIGMVGMRTREGTISADQLRSFLGTLDVPLVGFLRDTQNYVHLAARGLTLWDVAPSKVQRDVEQWESLLRWIQET